MKIVTGMNYRLMAAQTVPLMARVALNFEQGDGLLAPMPANYATVELWPLALLDPETGNVVSVVYFTKRPEFEHKELKLEYVTGMLGVNDWIQYRLREEGAPDDVQKKVESKYFQEVYTHTYSWVVIS